MQVSEQNYDGKEKGETKKSITQGFIIPKHQRHQKRDAGVSGKEKVVAGKDAVESSIAPKRRTDRYVIRERADVGDRHEDGANYGKNSDSFHDKWRPV